ncbi:MAG: hypothetical protein AB8B59_15655 [Maribacter sp.]
MEENKELDDFIRKSIAEVGLENPSIDFTNSVLSKIELENQNESVLVSKPLLSKATWFIILAALTVIFGYVLINSNTESTWLTAEQLNKFDTFNRSLNIPELSFSTTFIYGSISIALCVWIQIFFLKGRLDKNYIAG